MTVLPVARNALMALKIADFGSVIEAGEMALTGTGEELLDNEQVIEAYLG